VTSITALIHIVTMSAIADYLASLPDDAEEVDLSSFQLIEEIDHATWMELRSIDTMKRLKLPPSLLTIRSGVFSRRMQLTEVTFPSSLRSIGHRAFWKCTGLAMNDLKLPDSVEELGVDAFAHCEGLTGKLSTHITGEYSFFGCTGLSELDLENCKVIELYCFADCTRLTKLKLPSSLQRIERFAFSNCAGLTGPLIIPPFVSFIHPGAFIHCSNMTGIDQAIAEHFVRFESWKARGNVLMTLIAFDREYRRVVEQNGGTLRSDLSNSFLSDYSEDAQLIYKAAAHVDGTDELANGICRLIISFLPTNREQYAP
jgi:hypothetical protein